jgi:hypothetical protein
MPQAAIDRQATDRRPPMHTTIADIPGATPHFASTNDAVFFIMQTLNELAPNAKLLFDKPRRLPELTADGCYQRTGPVHYDAAANMLRAISAVRYMVENHSPSGTSDTADMLRLCDLFTDDIMDTWNTTVTNETRV